MTDFIICCDVVHPCCFYSLFSRYLQIAIIVFFAYHSVTNRALGFNRSPLGRNICTSKTFAIMKQ